MKIGRLSCVPIAVAILTTLVLAQLPKPTKTPDGAIDGPGGHQFDRRARPKIALRIYDFAGIDRLALTGARKVTTEIFREAGVEVLWLDCPVSEADCDKGGERPQFWLRIVPPGLAKDMARGEVLGFAVPCAKNHEACLFYIFYSRISALAAQQMFGPGLILGYVIAHEIGHTLLGPNAHDLYGIMQASLPMTDIGRMLYFTSEQTRRLRSELVARNREMKSRED